MELFRGWVFQHTRVDSWGIESLGLCWGQWQQKVEVEGRESRVTINHAQVIGEIEEVDANKKICLFKVLQLLDVVVSGFLISG